MRDPNQANDEFDMLEFAAPLVAKWKLLLMAMLLGALLLGGASRLMPRTYVSTATVYVQQSSPASSILRNLPTSLLPGSAGSTGYIITLLESESMRKMVISRLRLMRRKDFTEKPNATLNDALLALKKQVTVADNKNGSVGIIVRARTPKLAADIANTMLDSLGSLVVTASTRKADFIGERLSETDRQLNSAQDELVKFLETHDIALLDEDSKSLIGQVSEIEGRLLLLDEELQSVNSAIGNAGDPEQLVELEVRKRSLESSRAYVAQRRKELSDKLAGLPSVGAEYARIQRRIGVLTTTFELLTEQYQLARITQKGEDGDYQIVDRARPNPKKVSPRTSAFAGLGALLFLVVGIIIIRIKVSLREIRRAAHA